MIALRPYQLEAKAAVYDHLRSRDDNPCAVIPTAGGKTPVNGRAPAKRQRVSFRQLQKKNRG